MSTLAWAKMSTQAKGIAPALCRGLGKGFDVQQIRQDLQLKISTFLPHPMSSRDSGSEQSGADDLPVF